MGKPITSTLDKAIDATGDCDAAYGAAAERSAQLAIKRSLDVAFAVSFLVLFMPLLLGIAALLLIVQGRPILFAHTRLGRGGVPFKCYKFRTMVRDAGQVLQRHLDSNPAARQEWEETQKLKNDPRITVLGAVMRKLSIDELPQFINVLKGDMSLVGPRPIVASEARFYGPHMAEYTSVRPGITGLWQVSGRSNLTYSYRVELDVDYVRNWSFARDVLILAKTVPAVLTSDGSC